MNKMQSKVLDVKERESTEMGLIETDNNAISETSSMSGIFSIKGNNQTVGNVASAISMFEQESINRSKPWRQIIRRRVVDGGNYNES